MVARPSRGASLLRSSRMFSMPQPLRSLDSGTTVHNHSDTATTPFPIHLSVTTTEKSRANGDWGFKRALPLRKTTKSSTPVMRIKQVDSIEAVTDYASASDHSLTLEKFHEMGLAVSAPVVRYEKKKEGRVSVFEEASDRTSKPTEQLNSTVNAKRWKFNGPWLASLTEDEFQRFLKKEVRSRRTEFRELLRQHRAEELSQAATQRAMNAGEEPPPRLSPSDISEEDLTEHIRSLRVDRNALYEIITGFLDLAPVAPPQTSTNMWANSLDGTLPPVNPYAQDGPPITHPSAGLSYLRTSAYVENHPIYGPQKQHSPVLSRILSPQRGPEPPKLGMGGFVVTTPPGTTSFAHRYRDFDSRNKVQGLSTFDPSIPGGAAMYLVPHSAKISSGGNVVVKADEATPEAQLVQKEIVGAGDIYFEPRDPAPAPEATAPQEGRPSEPRQRFSRLAPGGRKVFGSSESYGLER